MTDFVHPALLFILGALPIPFLNGSIRKLYLLLIPALAILAVLTMQPGNLRRGVVPRAANPDREGRQAEHRLRHRFHHHGSDRNGLRAAPASPRPACRCVRLRRQRARRGVRRRLPDALPVLGRHGVCLCLSRLRPGRPASDQRRVPVSHGPYHRRRRPAWRRHSLRALDRLAALRPDRVGNGRRRLPDPCRVPAQRGGAAAQRLADGRLSGGDRHRGGVHERLHHQDRRLCAGARVSGDRASRLARHRDGALRRHLRGAGERLPAAAWPITSSARWATWWRASASGPRWR